MTADQQTHATTSHVPTDRQASTSAAARHRRSLRRLKHQLALWREFAADAFLYWRDCAPPDHLVSTDLRGRHLEAQITKDYHRIEKGLTLPEPRRGFGREVEDRLRALLPLSPDAAPYAAHGRRALEALGTWNAGGSIDDSTAPLYDRLAAADRSGSPIEALFTTRRSVRDFDSQRQPARELISHALRLAGESPSVCNRQPWRAHVFSDREQVQRMLACQNGNRGFAQTVPTVVVVTVDRRLFCGANERNQRWIDGALFAMSLVWALHGVGLASCMLNWSMSNRESAKLRAVGGLDPAEDVIVMIAVGYPNADHRVAASPRRPLSDIVVWHSPSGESA